MSFCKNCGNKLEDRAVICPKCGVPTQNNNTIVDGNNATLRMLIPVGRSGLAIAAGYVGLLSLIPFIGIIAILLGVFALKDIKSHPEKHGAGRAWFGIIAGGAFSLLYLVLMISS